MIRFRLSAEVVETSPVKTTATNKSNNSLFIALLPKLSTTDVTGT